MRIPAALLLLAMPLAISVCLLLLQARRVLPMNESSSSGRGRPHGAGDRARTGGWRKKDRGAEGMLAQLGEHLPSRDARRPRITSGTGSQGEGLARRGKPAPAGSTAQTTGDMSDVVDVSDAGAKVGQSAADVFEYPLAHPHLCAAHSESAVLRWAESLDAQVNAFSLTHARVSMLEAYLQTRLSRACARSVSTLLAFRCIKVSPSRA